MKIQKCTICGKLFFEKPRTTTDNAYDFDPPACSQCNENARQNSFPRFETPRIEIIPNPRYFSYTGPSFFYKRIPYVIRVKCGEVGYVGHFESLEK